MSGTFERPLPPETEGELDRLLAAWAAGQALPPGRAEAIRAAVLAGGGESPLTHEWWQTFTASLQAAIRVAGGSWRAGPAAVPGVAPQG
jgi:hypothetical protein